MNILRFVHFSSIILLLLFPTSARSVVEKPLKKIVKRYNKILRDTFPEKRPCTTSFPAYPVETLIHQISQMLSLNVEDPKILQKVDFLYSYEVIFSLEENPPRNMQDLINTWKTSIIELDIKAHDTSFMVTRPSAKWVIQKGKLIPSQPTKKMKEGYIERKDHTVYISDNGEVCGNSKKGCEQLNFVVVKCLVLGTHDPETARALLHEFPPVKANPRLVDYWEVPLTEKNCLIRRTYYLKPFPGYKGTMQNYYKIVYEDIQRLIALEQNVRKGKFVLRTDNAAVFIKLKFPPETSHFFA